MLYRALRPVLFCLDPEQAHKLALRALQLWGHLPPTAPVSETIPLLGLSFPNRVGMAAGFDKNGSCLDGLGRLGFGRNRAKPNHASSGCLRDVPWSIAWVSPAMAPKLLLHAWQIAASRA
jgi:Dihydroorotate dehydrogenase